MTQFARIEYPTCPECLTLQNDEKIFDLHDLSEPRYFHTKECLNPKCGKKFLMKTRVELQTEVVAVEV